MSKIILYFIISFLTFSSAQAYIGPGAGIGVLLSGLGFIVLIILLIISILIFPVKWIIKKIKNKKKNKN